LERSAGSGCRRADIRRRCECGSWGKIEALGRIRWSRHAGGTNRRDRIIRWTSFNAYRSRANIKLIEEAEVEEKNRDNKAQKDPDEDANPQGTD
jgi:hypothetical protein